MGAGSSATAAGGKPAADGGEGNHRVENAKATTPRANGGTRRRPRRSSASAATFDGVTPNGTSNDAQQPPKAKRSAKKHKKASKASVAHVTDTPPPAEDLPAHPATGGASSHATIPTHPGDTPHGPARKKSLTKRNSQGSMTGSLGAVPPTPPPPQLFMRRVTMMDKGTNTLSLSLVECVRLCQHISQQRIRDGKTPCRFRKDERHAIMELYYMVGLDDEIQFGEPNDLQIALKHYAFPPPNMVALRDKDVCDRVTFQRMLGEEEAARRLQTGGSRVSVPQDDKPLGSGDALYEQIRRQGVSSEAYHVAAGGDSMTPATNFLWKETPKTVEEIERLRKLTQSSILFKGLDSRDRTTVFNALVQESYQQGMDIIKQGEVGNEYYIIDSGKCQISINQDESDEDEVVGTLDCGDSFGELGLMYGTARAATITAFTNVVCWVLDRDTYRGILMNLQVRKRERYMAFLDSVNMFAPLQPYEKARVADMLQPSELPPDTVIVQEGEPGDTFYLIEDGLVEVSTQHGGVLTRLEGGSFFGELALINSQPRKATVTTRKTTHLVSLDRRSFKNYLGSMQDLLRHAQAAYQDDDGSEKKGTLSPSLSRNESDLQREMRQVLENFDYEEGSDHIFNNMPSTPSDAGSGPLPMPGDDVNNR